MYLVETLYFLSFLQFAIQRIGMVYILNSFLYFFLSEQGQQEYPLLIEDIFLFYHYRLQLVVFIQSTIVVNNSRNVYLFMTFAIIF